MKQRAVLFAVIAISLVSACDESTPSDREPTTTMEAASFALPWSQDETWYYIGGPHCDTGGDACGEEPRYAIDFSPLAPIYGNRCVPSVISQFWVTAAATGKVYVADRSLVEIEHEGGTRTGYYHLLTSSMQVAAGDHVSVGDRLGNPSCEHLRGGGTQGPHVHFYVCANAPEDDACLGNRDSLTGVAGATLSGWRVEAADPNYEGSLARGADVRDAANLLCDGSEATDAACDGRRNDVQP